MKIGDTMKNNSFIKSTLILIIGGMITKILGMFIKIVTTRIIGTEGIGVYMLINPTMMLLITISQLGFSTSISTLVSSEKFNNKKLIFSCLPITIIINILIIIFMFFFSGFIANTLLNEPRCHLGLLAASLILPFISISNILRGYYFGKQRMLIHVITNIVEDIIRLILLIIGIPIFLLKGLDYAVAFIIITNIVSEISSILIFIFFIPRNTKIYKDDIIPKFSIIKKILNLSLSITGSRLIGNLGSFLEPIILTNILLKTGYSNHYIVNEYGILNGYVMPMLLMPSFFTMAISQAIVPVVSKHYSKGNKKEVKRKIKQAIFFSLVIGIPATILFMIIPDTLLKLIYNNIEGVKYLKIMAPLFLILYIESPLVASMQAMGKSFTAMKGTLIGTVIKLLILSFLSFLKIGFYGYITAILFNIIFVTIYQIYHIKKYLNS